MIEDVDDSSWKERIYSAFVEYFNDIEFTKTEDLQQWSVYRCNIHCQLCLLKKYLVAFVGADASPVGTTARLAELKWVCFQTQTTPKDYKLRSQGYQPRKIELLNEKIRVVPGGRTVEKTTYQADSLPLRVDLVPKNKDKQYNKYEYAEEGTLRIALETYSTSITFV